MNQTPRAHFRFQNLLIEWRVHDRRRGGWLCPLREDSPFGPGSPARENRFRSGRTVRGAASLAHWKIAIPAGPSRGRVSRRSFSGSRGAEWSEVVSKVPKEHRFPEQESYPFRWGT